MTFEVEQKFRVSELSDLERRLAALGQSPLEAIDQLDCYYAHPGRDFAATDEALRLRRVGELNYITYKGPKLDATTKTRREVEIELAPGSQPAADAAELLELLGFWPVGQVSKRRVHSTLRWQGRKVGIALDDVVGLGTFVELEIMASESEVPAARQCLASLAEQLALGNSERRSYLELLLERGV